VVFGQEKEGNIIILGMIVEEGMFRQEALARGGEKRAQKEGLRGAQPQQGCGRVFQKPSREKGRRKKNYVEKNMFSRGGISLENCGGEVRKDREEPKRSVVWPKCSTSVAGERGRRVSGPYRP